MSTQVQNQTEVKQSTMFPYEHCPSKSFDAAALLDAVADGPGAPLEVARRLEEAHSLLIDLFLKGEFNFIYTSNILFTLRELRNALLKGESNVELG